MLASSDRSFRQRVGETLTGLRWKVREASGGAEALALLEAVPTEALILDSWLPDLEIREFIRVFARLHPHVHAWADRLKAMPAFAKEVAQLRHGARPAAAAPEDKTLEQVAGF